MHKKPDKYIHVYFLYVLQQTKRFIVLFVADGGLVISFVVIVTQFNQGVLGTCTVKPLPKSEIVRVHMTICVQLYYVSLL